MSRGLFSDLFAYRPRLREDEKQDRTPLEDWLTECLASCLRALLHTDDEVALQALSFLADRPIDELRSAMTSGPIPTVKTQFRCDDMQRPDLVIFKGDKPWIVVESKVEHTATVGQLAGYARWARENVGDLENAPMLVYLTHSTPCPAEFTESNPTFQGVKLAKRRWAGVGNKLHDLCSSLGDQSLARELCASFFFQLQDLNMSNEYPSAKTLASAQMFMLFGLELDLLVNGLLEDVSEIGDFTRQKTYEAQPKFDEGLYRAGRWANNVLNGIGAEVCVGIWFPESGSYRVAVEREMRVNVTETPKIFISVDSEALMEASTGCPAGWHRDDEEFLAFANYGDFSEDSSERAERAKSWVRERVQELKEHLAAGK